MAYKDEYTEIEYTEIVTETEKAVLFNIDGRELWIPKSVIDDTLDEDKKTFDVPNWFADKNNLR